MHVPRRDGPASGVLIAGTPTMTRWNGRAGGRPGPGHYPPAVPGCAPLPPVLGAPAAARPVIARSARARSILAQLALAGLVLTGLGAAGCGAATTDGPGGDVTAAGPTVAPADLGGRYEIGSWREAGDADTTTSASTPADERPYVEVDLDTQFGALTVATDCGIQLGSFSLLADGRAGVTLAGARAVTCQPEAEDNQRRLLATLARVDRWTGGDGELTLTSPAGDELVLVRPAR